MFVAIVFKDHPDTSPDSHKDHGGWESFLAHKKEDAVAKAILAAQRWETQPKVTQKCDSKGIPLVSTTKYYGPYRILVGEVTEEAARVNYSLQKFDEDVW